MSHPQFWTSILLCQEESPSWRNVHVQRSHTCLVDIYICTYRHLVSTAEDKLWTFLAAAVSCSESWCSVVFNTHDPTALEILPSEYQRLGQATAAAFPGVRNLTPHVRDIAIFFGFDGEADVTADLWDQFQGLTLKWLVPGVHVDDLIMWLRRPPDNGQYSQVTLPDTGILHEDGTSGHEEMDVLFESLRECGDLRLERVKFALPSPDSVSRSLIPTVDNATPSQASCTFTTCNLCH